MDDLLEELKSEIDANSEISFIELDADSVMEFDTIESDHTDYLTDDSGSKRYTDTPLTDDAVTTMEGWLDNDHLHTISDDIVAEHVDEILLLLVSIRGRACGKELLQDIRRLFGSDLSPGTVYPHLKTLADEGVLEVSELTKRKVYRLSDTETAISRVETVVDQLLTLSLVLKAAMADCKVRQSLSEKETNE